tara:strand:- start:4804 stop:4968 length:165 start_codon:yes stop_codon:yes gene_type:complete
MGLNPKSLSLKLQEFIEDKGLREKMGKSLNKRASHSFSLDNYFKNLEKFYNIIE